MWWSQCSEYCLFEKVQQDRHLATDNIQYNQALCFLPNTMTHLVLGNDTCGKPGGVFLLLFIYLGEELCFHTCPRGLYESLCVKKTSKEIEIELAHTCFD